jgi:hypothetical protein
MLSTSRRLLRSCPERNESVAALVDFAAALPGVISRRDACGRVMALGLRAGEALGPPDALFEDGSFARRDASRGGLEVILPEVLWRRAVARRLACITTAPRADATSRVTRLDAPEGGLAFRDVEELVEGAWAYARGL